MRGILPVIIDARLYIIGAAIVLFKPRKKKGPTTPMDHQFQVGNQSLCLLTGIDRIVQMIHSMSESNNPWNYSHM